MYIYDNSDWPKFFWEDKRIIPLLIQARHLQGRLIGAMGSIGFQFNEKTVLDTLTQEVLKSSEIEGEILDPGQVRSSVARHLGIEAAALGPTDRHIEGVVEMMINATQQFDQPLTKDRLFLWHTLLFPNGRSGFTKIQVGNWRKGSVQVVSGRPGKEIVHFEGPKAINVEKEMEQFLNWVNQENKIDLILKAAVTHLWFVTIHPFDDGNGRIGRAIADLILARSENSSRRFYSLSAQIQIERKGYYQILENTQKGGLDITPWIEWFLHCLETAIKKALSTLDGVKKKERAWEFLETLDLNERQKKILNRLFDGFEGNLTTSKWAKIAKCSQDTAYRDILELVDKGILIKNRKGGRSTSYLLIDWGV